MCIMRNLSYHVHKEVPGAEKFQDPSALQAPGSAGPQRKKKDDAGCFGGKKAKGEIDKKPSIIIQTCHLRLKDEVYSITWQSEAAIRRSVCQCAQ